MDHCFGKIRPLPLPQATMRALQASTILSLVTTVVGFSNESLLQRRSRLNSRDQRRQEDPIAALRNPIETTAKRQKRQRKVIRAPLVDSQLLRFVGTQKERLQETNSARTSSVPGYDDITSNTQVSADSPSISKEENEDDIDTGSAAPATYDSSESQPPNDSDSRQRLVSSNINTPPSSFGQFNDHRVSLVLENHGADPELARRAGECVQAHALSRTTRRRIRTFLKERDIVWRNTMFSESEEVALTTPLQKQREGRISERNVRPNVDSSMEGLPSIGQKAGFTDDSFQKSVDLMLSRGLAIRDVCEILLHSPGVALMRPTVEGSTEGAGETLEETLDRTLNLLMSTLSLRKYDARKILRTTPGLLSMRGSKQAEQLVHVMSQSLGVSTSSLARDKCALSTLLSRTPAAMFRFIAFLSSDCVRMPMDNIGPLIRRDICHSLLDQVAPVIPVIEHGQDDSCVITALWNRRQALHDRRENINAIYQTMTRTAKTLRDEIGTEDLGKVIAAYPSVLLLDAETQILPVADYLMKQLGIWEDDLPRVLQSFPALLGLDRDQMDQVIEYLLSIEVPEEKLGNIIRSFPALLALNVEKDIQPVVAFLRNEVGISNVGRFVGRLPAVLGYSVERDLQPKWEFLQKISVDARFEASRFPAYFSYPFDRVIKARYEYLVRVKKLPPSLLPLDSVLRHGDKEFSFKVAGDVDGGKGYRSFCEMRRAARADAKRKLQNKREPRVPVPPDVD